MVRIHRQRMEMQLIRERRAMGHWSNRRFLKILRSERGTLYEIPLLIVILLLVLAVGVPVFHQQGITGLLRLALGVILIGALIAGFAWAYLKFIETSPSRKKMVQYLTGVMVDLLFGGFIVGIFDAFLFLVFPDLKLDIVVGIEGALLLAFSLGHSYHQMRKKPKGE
jgi:hypothetical protein